MATFRATLLLLTCCALLLSLTLECTAQRYATTPRTNRRPTTRQVTSQRPTTRQGTLQSTTPFPFPFNPNDPHQNERPYEWNQLDYQFPSPQSRQEYIRTGAYIPRVNTSVPACAEVAGSRVFVAVPRWGPGVPSTLNYVNPVPRDQRPPTSPLLIPYPSLEFNRQGNCNGFTSVYRMKADGCGRLWVLDTGKVNNFFEAQQLCPCQLYVFDLATDRVIHKFVFPKDVIRDETLLVTLEVEYPRGGCGSPRDAVVYAADSDAFALIVANMNNGEAWRLRDKTMFPSPEAGTISISGESFELMDGIFGLALKAPNPNSTSLVQSGTNQNTLYFSALNSFQQRWVNTNILRNRSAAFDSPQAFHTGQQLRSSQSGDSAIDSEGVLYFGLFGDNALACWNTRLPFTKENIGILVQDDELMQFVISVQVDNQDRIWVMSTRFQKLAVGTLSANETNIRIFMAPARMITQGTPCDTTTAISPRL